MCLKRIIYFIYNHASKEVKEDVKESSSFVLKCEEENEVLSIIGVVALWSGMWNYNVRNVKICKTNTRKSISVKLVNGSWQILVKVQFRYCMCFRAY